MIDDLIKVHFDLAFVAGVVLCIVALIFRKRLKKKYKLIFLLGIAITIIAPLYAHHKKVEFVKERNKQIEADKVAQQIEFEKNRIRLIDVPKEVVEPCLDDKGRLADRNDEWQETDFIKDPSLPTSRMVLACKYPDGTWYIQCEKGGFAPQRLQFRVSKDAATQLAGELKQICTIESK